MRRRLLLLLLATGTTAHAGDEPLNFRGGFTWINAYVRNNTLDENPKNPDNKSFELPEDSFVSELRPNVKVVSNSLSLIARPRVTFDYSRARVDDELKPLRAKTKTTWSEAFAQWTLSESATFAYGQQNYQWGAAESLSPSNRIVHETVQAKNPLYDVRGKHLARMNLSLGKVLSFIVMSEVEEDKDTSAFVFGEEFESTSLAKLEVNWSNGASYLGIVGGSRESGSPWVGEYLNIQLPFLDSLSLYADASHQRGSDAWYPVAETEATVFGEQEVISLRQSRSGKRRVYSITVAGMRWDFDNGNHIRFEYIDNQVGYDKDERKLLSRALTEETPWQLGVFQQNLERALAPGLELPGRRYGFASVSLPDVFKIQDLFVYLRTMHSMQDRSSNTYLSTEYSVGEAGMLLLAGSFSNGDDDAELRGAASPTYLAGYKHQW